MSGTTFIIGRGEVLLAPDSSGTGHAWKLPGDDRWRRACVIYEGGADLGFRPANV